MKLTATEVEIKSKLLCTVQFSGGPANSSIPTDCMVVSSRRVKDLTDIPKWAKRITFAEHVECAVSRSGCRIRVKTPAFWEKTYLVERNGDQVPQHKRSGWTLVKGPAHLNGKVWVFENNAQRRRYSKYD
jgi:hypothetical protein